MDDRRPQPPSGNEVPHAAKHQVAVDRPSAIASGALLTAIAALPFNLLPLILGSAAEQLGLDDAQLGIFGGAYLAGVSVATIASPFWIRRASWRRAVLVGTAIGVSGLLLAAVTSHFASTMAALALAGVGLATSFAPGITLIGDTSQPNRNFGVLILAQVGLAAAVGVALSAVDEAWGFSGIMVLFAVISVGNLGCARWLPTRGAKEIAATSDSSPAASNAPVIVGLFAYFVFYASVTAVWAFLELIANEFGISDARVGVVISSSLLIGGFGALGATLVGGRVRPATAIAVGAIGTMLAALVLLGTLSYGVYFAAVCLFQITWNFGIAFQLGLIATLDISGRFVVLSTAFATTGAVLGPALGGILAASTEGYAGPIGLGIAGTGVSLMIYLWCAAQRRRVFGATERLEGAEDLHAGGT